MKRFESYLKASKRWLIASIFLIVVLLAIRLYPHTPLHNLVPTSSAIYARNGELMRLTLASDEQYRFWVSFNQIDPRLIEAVKLYEDRWFSWHIGVNPVSLSRAFIRTYGDGEQQGASTITMQLARQLYKIQSQTLSGKFKQIVAALWLETRYSKRDILEAYMNIAPYGGNIEGVGAASLIYFHKQAKELTLPEILTLAVIPQNPNKRGVQSLRQAKHNELIDARDRLWQSWMQRYPDDARYKTDHGISTHLFSSGDLPFRAPHLTDFLLRQNHSGEILSSIDLHTQTSIERILTQYITVNHEQGINNASAMLLDTRTGEVNALVGSANYFDDEIDGQVNGTQAKRSPGSTLKPFIYGLALDQGLLHPLTVLKDAPTAFGPFSPENFDGRFVGPITAQDALIRSRNIPAVAIASKLAQPNLYEFLKQSGVSKLASEKHYGLALALGGGEVTMEELARIYLMLANRGVLSPILYEKRSEYKTSKEKSRLLSDEASFITLQMLKNNPRPDTAEPASPSVAWKTGTSWGFRDAWSAGIFGHYVLIVWVGNFDGSSNPAFVGVKTAAPLFFKIIDSLRGQGIDMKETQQPLPANVTKIEVCSESGDLPNALCKNRSRTWFIPGKTPIKVSTLHRAIKIDTLTGQATCNDGPFVKTEIFEFWPTDMQRLFREAGMPRRQPPAQPACAPTNNDIEDAPHIVSPNRDTIYTLQLSKPTPIALRANSTSAQQTLFWFSNDGLIGKNNALNALAWSPISAGRYQLRVIDQQGRTDSREVTVEMSP